MTRFYHKCFGVICALALSHQGSNSRDDYGTLLIALGISCTFDYVVAMNHIESELQVIASVFGKVTIHLCGATRRFYLLE